AAQGEFHDVPAAVVPGPGGGDGAAGPDLAGRHAGGPTGDLVGVGADRGGRHGGLCSRGGADRMRAACVADSRQGGGRAGRTYGAASSEARGGVVIGWTFMRPYL